MQSWIYAKQLAEILLCCSTPSSALKYAEKKGSELHPIAKLYAMAACILRHQFRL